MFLLFLHSASQDQLGPAKAQGVRREYGRISRQLLGALLPCQLPECKQVVLLCHSQFLVTDPLNVLGYCAHQPLRHLRQRKVLI